MKLPGFLLAAALLALALPALARETCWLRPIPAQDSWSREECDRFLAASNAGAPLDLTFVVESADPADGHAPVAGAEVRWLCPPPLSWGPPPDDEKGSFAAVSDTNGIARLQGVATNWPGSSAMFSSALTPPLYSRGPRLPGVRFPALRVSREGFYTRLSPMVLGPPDESGAWTAAPADGSGWGVEGECFLRRVRRPHPMRVSSFAAGADFPEGPVGYDAGRGAFLPPLGDGETADFFVESGQTPGAWPCATYRWIVVRPAGPDGALALVPAFPDELRTPNEVPGPSMPGSDLPFLPPGAPLRFLHPFRWGRAGAVFGTGCTALSNEMWNHCVPPEATADEGGGLAAHNAIVFRSRVRPAADGGAAAVRYGAIVPPDIDDEFLCPARFLVRFNETDGERGLEPADLRVPEPAARAAAAPAGERLVEGPWAYRLLDGGRGVVLAGFDAIPETPGGVLALPAELGGRPVVEIEPGAFSPLRFDGSETSRFFDRRDAAWWWRTNTVQLVVPEGVRSIGARAFAGFAPARTLSLPSTLEALGRECFVDCIRLESVALPPSVAAVPSAAFQGCLALRSASAPGARTVAPFAFAQCPDLATVRLAPGAAIDPWAFRDSPRANAPAATLEQLLAEPWRKRLSPDADPVAEMRKIGTLDAFADTRVLFLGPGVCVTRLRNDPGHIAYARAQSRLVRYLFRGTRPAAGVDFARGGSSRLLAFDALPREGDPEFPRPVRAVPFEFDAFAPADAPEDLVVRLPGEDRWVRVPGLGEVAMPRLSAADPATNAPAATLARAEADLHGETFERWRFTIRPDLVTGRPAVIDGLMAFLGRPSIWWPPGSSMERSGDDGFVVLNTRENLDTIRMILGELSVNVDRGEPVVLEDSPATNAPDTAASDCARFLESAFREIDPGTNGAPAAVVLGDLRWSIACESSISSDSGSAVRHCPWHPEAGERIVIPDKTELTLHIGKHQFVRIARIPPDTSLPESLDEKDRAVADAVGGPLLVVERRENYSSFGHAERNVAIRHYILPTGAREGHPFHPPAGAPARFLFADLAPAHAEPVPHAESEPHAESAETAEP